MTTKAFIRQLDTDDFALVAADGQTIETYGRARDARRGAARRGLAVA